MGERANQPSDQVETDPFAQMAGLKTTDFKYDKKTGAATADNGTVVQEHGKGWDLKDPNGNDLASFDKATGHWTSWQNGEKVNVDDKIGFKPDPNWFDPDAWTADGKLKDGGGTTSGGDGGSKSNTSSSSTTSSTTTTTDTTGGGGGGTNVTQGKGGGSTPVSTGDVYVQPDDSEAGRAGPLEHKKAKGVTMADANGRCVSCGWETPSDQAHCTHCDEDFTSWNDKVDQFTESHKKAGWTDKQMQDEWDKTYGQVHAQGLQHEFTDSQADID